VKLLEEFDRHSAELTQWRQDLHRYPELAFDEHRTSAFIADKLREFRLDPQTGIGGTGIVAVIEGEGSGRSIGLRADIDALPMEDESGRPYASTVAGRAHACGHDGHTVAMLGVARYLAQHPPRQGRVVLIFQPAEEKAAGAIAMIRDGLFERFPIDEIYAFHNMPSLATGSAAVEAGTTLNGACLWTATIEGVGGHGASFFTTVDPLQAAARLVVEISSLVGRHIDPAEQVLISTGKLQAGTAANIIPATATVSGTLRGRTMDGMARMKALLERSCDGIAALTGCSVTLDIEIAIPPCVNAPAQAEAAAKACRAVMGDDNVADHMAPLPFTDDFAHFLAAVPGAYMFLGQDSVMCHNPAYDFDDALLPVAGSIFVSLVKDRLEGKGEDAAHG